MKKNGSGVILNMGWDQAAIGMEGDSGQLFAASKAELKPAADGPSADPAARARENLVQALFNHTDFVTIR